jgi:glutamine cyclotransferase
MMTYRERKVFVFDPTLGTIKREYDMPKEIKEGWGMTHYRDANNKDVLLISDGSNNIFHVDPEDFSIIDSVQVVDFNGDKLD